MTEELAQTTVAGSGGAPAGALAAGAASTQPVADGGDVESRIKAEIAKVRAEYEGKGGHLSKVKSEADKAKAELDRVKAGQVQRQAAEMQQARAMLAQDPQRAGEYLAQQNEALLRAQYEQSQQGALQSWAQEMVQNYGLEWDEAIDKLAAETGLGANPKAPWAFLGAVGEHAAQKARDEAAAAKKELETTVAGLGDTIKAEVKRALAAAGYTEPDTSTPGSPTSGEDWQKLTPDERMRYALREERRADKSKR